MPARCFGKLCRWRKESVRDQPCCLTPPQARGASSRFRHGWPRAEWQATTAFVRVGVLPESRRARLAPPRCAGAGSPRPRRTGGTGEKRATGQFSLPGRVGAGDGIRTRDNRLGKPALYQLSYSRIRLSLSSIASPAIRVQGVGCSVAVLFQWRSARTGSWWVIQWGA